MHGKDLIQLGVPTWNVQDATKLNAYMECPRKYFYEYVLGWRVDRYNIHLEYGKAFHEAMEVLEKAPAWNEDVLLEAIEAFSTHYDSIYSFEQDADNAPKDKMNTIRALKAYTQAYSDDKRKATTLHTEVAGSVPVDDNGERTLYFKMDTILIDKQGIFSREHKTGSRRTWIWENKWQTAFQVDTYFYALFFLFGNQHKIKNITINGIFLKKGGNEFLRIPITKQPRHVAEFLYRVNMLLEQLRIDFAQLSEDRDDALIMKSFRKNTQSCDKYSGCPFMSLCSVRTNPLQGCEAPPIGYKVEHWDPREMEDEASTVVKEGKIIE